MFSKVFELHARKNEHRGSLCCSGDTRSTVVGHVPRNMSAGCALFLRRNHLRMVLFTRAQSCHEKFGHARVHCACALCVWVVLTSCLSLARI